MLNPDILFTFFSRVVLPMTVEEVSLLFHIHDLHKEILMLSEITVLYSPSA